MESQTLKFDFIFLGQSILKYQVPLDIFTAINQIYEQNFHKLNKANNTIKVFFFILVPPLFYAHAFLCKILVSIYSLFYPVLNYSKLTIHINTQGF